MLPGKTKQTAPPQTECIQRLTSCGCGDGELSLVSHCRDRVRPWLPQHPVPIVTPCGLAQKQPQQPCVGHHLHHTSAAAPAASSRAQVRANAVYPGGCQHISQSSALGAQSGGGWPDLAGCWGKSQEAGDVGLYYTGMVSFKAASASAPRDIILRLLC